MASLSPDLIAQLRTALSQGGQVTYTKQRKSAGRKTPDTKGHDFVLYEPGDTKIKSEQLEVLKALFARCDETQRPAFLECLIRRLTEYSVEVVTFALFELSGTAAVLSLLSSEEGAEYEVAIWCCVDARLIHESFRFTDEDLKSIKSYLDNISIRLKHLPSPMTCQASRTKSIVDFIQFRRLKKAVLEGFNPEINEDKARLVSRMEALGFRGNIATALNRLELDVSKAQNELDYKSCADLTRTIFEEVVEDAARNVAKRNGITIPTDKSLRHFRTFKDILVKFHILTTGEERVAQELYNYLSNEGTHSLGSKQEQVRVTKNIMIEISLLVVGRV